MFERCLMAWAVTTSFAAPWVHAAELAPRTPLPKGERVAAVDESGHLIVKFSDASRIRFENGVPVSLGGFDVTELTRLQEKFAFTLQPLIRLSHATIAGLERRAALASGIEQPDLAGLFIVDVADDLRVPAAQALNELDLSEVVTCSPAAPPPPCNDLFPASGLYTALQDYHGADPGINMTAAWALGGARGAGITLADCEYGVNTEHEDLCHVMTEPDQTVHPQVAVNGWDEHGTAVMGELTSIDNLYGTRGLVPEAKAMFFTEWSVEEGLRRVTAIARAIDAVDAGDVIVLEMQTIMDGDDFGPAELDPAVWLLVRTASDIGIIVVAAAGNGAQNLDDPAYESYRSRGDSGAILVGAGSPDADHDALDFSTYGSRVNLQGWGQYVFTTGYGAYAEHGQDKNQRYTAGFAGTSAATPMAAAACVALQSMAIARCRPPLGPEDLRQVLIETGIPQGDGGHVGPLPDVAAAATALGLDSGATPCACPADLDADGRVGFSDLLRIFVAWGPCGGCPEDLDGNGIAGNTDLITVLSVWGPCP